MIDLESGTAACGVGDMGGFLGMGNKLFAVPWSTMRLDTDSHELLLDVDKEMLETAPGFDRDDWPDFGDPTWGRDIYSHIYSHQGQAW